MTVDDRRVEQPKAPTARVAVQAAQAPGVKPPVHEVIASEDLARLIDVDSRGENRRRLGVREQMNAEPDAR